MKFKINETKTARLYTTLTNDKSCAIISAYKSDFETSEEQNKQRMLALKSEVRSLGFGYTQFISKWVQDGVAFNESSLLIGNIDLDKAIELGTKYEQYSIVYKDAESCREICTMPFENYQVGDTVRVFNIKGNNVLNIEEAKEIFAHRKAGAVSKPVNGTRPFTLKQEGFELYEVMQPRPSVFETEYRYKKLI